MNQSYPSPSEMKEIAKRLNRKRKVNWRVVVIDKDDYFLINDFNESITKEQIKDLDDLFF